MRKLILDELGRPAIDDYRNMPKNPIVVVLDSIRSALNVGSVFRTSDAFAIEKIILCGISATPPNREITKTAIGATESVSWSYQQDIKDAVSELRNLGYKIVGVEQTDSSVKLNEFTGFEDRIALVFGNEVDGISESILNDLDYCIEIPQYGTKHSLNVSVCVGIILWTLTHPGI